MKKETKHLRANIVNKSLFYIYKHIDTAITLEELARLNSVSKYHFHRIFKEETGENLFERINAIRLQKAANLLITNSYSSISEIAQLCGYASHSSFIKAFKQRFNYTPTQWRNGSYQNFSHEILNVEENFLESFKDLTPQIKVIPKRYCAYIRNKGYDIPSVTKIWQRLLAFSYEHQLENATQLGIYHDNPVITHYKEGHYIAAIEVDKSFDSNSSISTFEMPKVLCAVFRYQGKFGDVARLITYIYHHWLPNSGYETKTLPAFAIYYKNHCLGQGDDFDLDFHVPISVI